MSVPQAQACDPVETAGTPVAPAGLGAPSRRVLARLAAWRGSLSRLRWWAVRALAPRRVVRARGLAFTLQCDNWITRYRYDSYTSKEPETLEWIDRRLRPGDTVFDVGANIGLYSIYAALRHADCRVIAFEPEYANLHFLRDNILHNRLQGRVEVYAMGVGNRSGLSRLHIQDLTPGAALHTESREALRLTMSRKPVIWREGIYTMTLDQFCEETGCVPNGIKIDVDGTEPQVLEGAVGTLERPELRSVLIELPDDHAAQEACEQRLAAAGLSREWDGRLSQSSNQLWVRRGA